MYERMINNYIAMYVQLNKGPQKSHTLIEGFFNCESVTQTKTLNYIQSPWIYESVFTIYVVHKTCHAACNYACHDEWSALLQISRLP